LYSQKASVEYHNGETAEEGSAEEGSDPKTGTSFSLGAQDVKAGATMRWESARPTPASTPLGKKMREVYLYLLV